jgi:hypothetical protein
MSESDHNNAEVTRKEQLLNEGWTRRFIYDEPRLTEAKEMYESMGFEVRLEPVVTDELEDNCDTCIKSYPERYKILYTRPRK